MNDEEMKTLYGEAFDLFRAEEYDKAVPLLQALANEEHAEAQYQLGICYFRGEGVQQDYAKAFELWTKAAEHSHIASMNTLYDCYENGTGVEKDEVKTKYWWDKLPKYARNPAGLPDYVMERAWSDFFYSDGSPRLYINCDRKPRER